MEDQQRQHLEKLRQTNQKRLNVLELQAATYGISAPAHILIEIEEIRDEIESIDTQLAGIKQLVPRVPEQQPISMKKTATDHLNASIVRIQTATGRITGAGFLVDKRQIITCAHVITGTLGGLQCDEEPPQAQINLDFPLIAAGQILTAQVIIWEPEEDIAKLELDNLPPAGAHPVPLVTTGDLWGHSFRAFGFPEGYDLGVWASGVLRGKTANGWLQIEDVKEPGYRVQPGFSGGPVWDEVLEGVVGIVNAADTQLDVKAAFIIPAEMLV